MVYCGPPSKGCSHCRDRKIRCDQREPGCGQCEKRQQKCPGYRNMVDLMFRDESSNVIKKAQAKHQRRKIASATTPEPALLSPGPDTMTAEAAATLFLASPTPSSLGLPTTPSLPLTPVKLDFQQLQHAQNPLTLLTPGLNNILACGNSPIPSPVMPSFHHYQPPLQNQRQSKSKQKRQQAAAQATAATPTAAATAESATSSSAQPSTLIWAHDDNLLPSPDAGSWPTTPMIARMYNLAPTWQERGTAYFFSRYVTIGENVLHQRFDFIYDIWKPGSPAASQQLDGVMASMTAVGLVGISQLTRSKDVIDSARMSYGTALRLLHAALKDPGGREAAKDTTMLSILILGVFEMMADPGLKTMQTWHEHVNGAVGLATMRGAAQLQTHAGRRMFNMLCQSVMISCMQRQVPMPDALVRLQNDMFAQLAQVDAQQSPQQALQQPGKGFNGADVSKPVYKVLQARSDIMAGRLADLDEMLARLDDIEAEFERSTALFPSTCRYKVFRVTKPHKAVFRDICHVYPSISTASIWNWLRACRILTLETVLAAIQQRYPSPDNSVPAHYMEAYRKAWAKLEQVSGAIVASVPQHFGLVNPVNPYYDTLKAVPSTTTMVTTPVSTTEVREPPTPPAQSPASSSTASVHSSVSDDRFDALSSGSSTDIQEDSEGPTLQNPTRGRSVEEEAERFMLLASATNSIVWPLYCAGTSSPCSASLKAYAIERLMAVHDETGLHQARAVAGIVRQRVRISSLWHRKMMASSHRHHQGRRADRKRMMPPPVAAALASGTP